MKIVINFIFIFKNKNIYFLVQGLNGNCTFSNPVFSPSPPIYKNGIHQIFGLFSFLSQSSDHIFFLQFSFSLSQLEEKSYSLRFHPSETVSIFKISSPIDRFYTSLHIWFVSSTDSSIPLSSPIFSYDYHPLFCKLHHEILL